MTLKEADVAAMQRRPVVHNGIEYKYITRTGYKYLDVSRRNQRVGFVELADKSGNSFTEADPAQVTLKEGTPW